MSDACYCDVDRPEFYQQNIRTARKRHKCTECRGVILPGEKYEHVAGKWDGYFDTFKICERCYDLRTWVKNNVPCQCIVYGDQDNENELAIDEARYRAPEETRGLRFGYLRRKVMRDRLNEARR